jgi:hypothetical protein
MYGLFFIYNNYTLFKFNFIPFKYFKVYLVSSLLIINILFSISPISRIFWSDKFLNNNFYNYLIDEKLIFKKELMFQTIPLNENISISTQNNVYLGFLSKRIDLYVFPYGVFQIDSKNNEFTFLINSVDYVILDTSKLFFIGDFTCYFYQSCYSEFSYFYNMLLNSLHLKYNLIYEYNGLKIFKKYD